MAESNFSGSVHGSYDLAFYGETTQAEFCCLCHGTANTIDEILGTPQDDLVILAGPGSQLEVYGQSLLEVEVRAFKEEDIIVGSNETSAAYSEYLRGYGHADIISSGAGNAIVGGGWGADVLHSGDGVDV